MSDRMVNWVWLCAIVVILAAAGTTYCAIWQRKPPLEQAAVASELGPTISNIGNLDTQITLRLGKVWFEIGVLDSKILDFAQAMTFSSKGSLHMIEAMREQDARIVELEARIKRLETDHPGRASMAAHTLTKGN